MFNASNIYIYIYMHDMYQHSYVLCQTIAKYSYILDVHKDTYSPMFNQLARHHRYSGAPKIGGAVRETRAWSQTVKRAVATATVPEGTACPAFSRYAVVQLPSSARNLNSWSAFRPISHWPAALARGLACPLRTQLGTVAFEHVAAARPVCRARPALPCSASVTKLGMAAGPSSGCACGFMSVFRVPP